jgi:hypothetical protein
MNAGKFLYNIRSFDKTGIRFDFIFLGGIYMMKSQEETKQWLESLQVGDEVAIRKGSYGYSYFEIHKIEKISKTRRFLLQGMSGTTFSNKGREMGKKDTWSPLLNIEPVTQKINDDIAKRKFLQEINNAPYKEFSLETLHEIYILIQKEKVKKVEGA